MSLSFKLPFAGDARAATSAESVIARIEGRPAVEDLPPAALARIREMEARHRAEVAELRRSLERASTDAVTGLPNRTRVLAELAAAASGQEGGVGFAIFDIDGFRRINTNHGPHVGDALLRVTAERLMEQTAAPEGQTLLGRIGPDQFGLIVRGTGSAEFLERARLAALVMSDPCVAEGHTFRLTAACGAARRSAGESLAAPDIVKRAEVALREAKGASGARIVLYDAPLHQRASQLARLENELRLGLDREEFVALFQPKVDFSSGELVGAEALARWRRPDGEVVSPGRFVPLAEDLGLIPRLGARVMRAACRAAAGWRGAGSAISIAVNVSSYEIDEPDFVDRVMATLEETRLDPNRLELEITESAAVRDPDRVARILWPLRSRGVRLAIDDFGTGHSNLSAITRLPFDTFKIDQQFVRALSPEGNAAAIVEMILAMAETLGQKTVAEGVETREQAEFLIARNCKIAQGYYFAPPLPSEEFTALSASWAPRRIDRRAA